VPCLQNAVHSGWTPSYEARTIFQHPIARCRISWTVPFQRPAHVYTMVHFLLSNMNSEKQFDYTEYLLFWTINCGQKRYYCPHLFLLFFVLLLHILIFLTYYPHTFIRLLSFKVFTFFLPPLFLVVFLILLYLLLLMLFRFLILLGLVVNLSHLMLPSLPATLLPAPPPPLLLRLLNIPSNLSSPSFPTSLYNLIMFLTIFIVPSYSRVLLFVFSPNIILYAYYRGVDKSLAWPTFRYILFDGENI